MKIVLFIAEDNKRDSAISAFCRNKILTPAEILFKISRWLMTSSRRWLMRSQWYKMTWLRRLSRTQKTDSGHSNIRDHHKWWPGTQVRSSVHLRRLNSQRQTDRNNVDGLSTKFRLKNPKNYIWCNWCCFSECWSMIFLYFPSFRICFCGINLINASRGIWNLTLPS